MKIYVTDIGIVSSLGTGIESHLQALNEGQSGISRPVHFQSRSDVLVGEFKETNAAITKEISCKYPLCSRTSLLGILAGREAWKNRVVGKKDGLISSTSIGGMDLTEKNYRQVKEKNADAIDLLKFHDSGKTSEVIGEHIGPFRYINTISTACSSAANAIMLGARMIRAGMIDRALVGGVDPLCDFTIQGFRSLMIYDSEHCKPFDSMRKGLNLGEGAGFLVLENKQSVTNNGSEPLAILSGWANAADAHHQTASSEDGKGATLAMQGALEIAELNASDIDYINAHGTGTANNDLSESVAFKNVFGENVPAFSSTKSLTGHTLAAAGGLEAIFSVLSIQNNIAWQNVNFNNPISESGLTPLTENKAAPIRHVLSNSFGFGGNNSTIIFSKI